MPTSQVKDKEGEPINVGDSVWTPFRGGKHEGTVANVVTTEEEAKEEGVKNPPKVGTHPTYVLYLLSSGALMMPHV
jgi:hypothetical protein